LIIIFQNSNKGTINVGGSDFDDVEVNGRLTSALEMGGAVVFVSSKAHQSCHGTERNVHDSLETSNRYAQSNLAVITRLHITL